MGKYTVTTTPTFESEFKKLKKKYRQMTKDYKDFLTEIEDTDDLGTELRVTENGEKIYKKRMSNISANRGKRGGFRVIELLVIDENEVFLLDIYSKSEKEDISDDEIDDLIKMNTTYIKEKLSKP